MSQIKPRVCVGAALVLGVWAASAGMTARADTGPGRFPASIRLEMPRAEVWKHIGKPTQIHSLHAGGRTYACDRWDTHWREWTIFAWRGRVVQTEDRLLDDADIGTFAAFRRQHPRVRVRIYELRGEVGAVMVADDVRRGVAWTHYVHARWDPAIHLLAHIQPDRIIRHQPGRAALPDVSDTLNERDPLRHDFQAWFAAGPPAHRRR